MDECAVWTLDGQRVTHESPIQYSYRDLQDAIENIDNRRIERYLSRLASKAEKFSEFSQINPRLDRLEYIFLRIMQRSISGLERRGRVDKHISEDLETIINYLSKK